MARSYFGIEKLLRIFKTNSNESIDILFGNGVPPGVSGETDDAAIGSLYSDNTNGALYIKKTATSSASDWVGVGALTIDELKWRNEKVIAATGDTLTAGSGIDPTAWSDNEQGLDGDDIPNGTYVIGDVDGSPALFEKTAQASATSITLVAASQAIADNDTFIVQNYLPDSPASQEDQAIVHIPTAGSAAIKIADVNWNFADGIQMAASYTAQSGTSQISNSDTVNSSVEKLDYRTKPATQTGVSAATVLDSVLVDEARSVVWLVTAFDEANPADVKSALVHGANNGTTSADATLVDDNVSSLLQSGVFNTQLSVVLNGAGAAQEMRLQVASSEPNVTYTAMRLGVAPSGY